MIIKVPNNNTKERQYVIDILLSEYLGLNYKIEYSAVTDYEILLENNNKLIIKDSFFSKYKSDTYLHKKNIPENINYLKDNEFSQINNLPIIYGNDSVTDSKSKIICDIDIFASSFYMLTRWEENVITERDKHDRFPDNLSLAFKFNFTKRAIVNEYTELLWNMLIKLGIDQKRSEKEYNLFLTHDVDFFRRFNTFNKRAKTIAGDIFKRKNINLAKTSVKLFSEIKKGKEKDPFDTFDYLMAISDKYNVKSHFYFIPEIIGEADAQYNITDKYVAETIKNINKKDHIVGAHFGWNTFNNKDLILKEKERLENITEAVNESRQHFLRFENSVTWQYLEQSNIKCDSTLGYNSDIGFRCGTCYEFSVFDIINRKKLKLKEYPLLVMDTALASITNNKDEFIKQITEIHKTVKQFNGTFVLLWHQNSFNLPEWDFVKHEYDSIIELLSS